MEIVSSSAKFLFFKLHCVRYVAVLLLVLFHSANLYWFDVSQRQNCNHSGLLTSTDISELWIYDEYVLLKTAWLDKSFCNLGVCACYKYVYSSTCSTIPSTGGSGLESCWRPESTNIIQWIKVYKTDNQCVLNSIIIISKDIFIYSLFVYYRTHKICTKANIVQKY